MSSETVFEDDLVDIHTALYAEIKLQNILEPKIRVINLKIINRGFQIPYRKWHVMIFLLNNREIAITASACSLPYQ